MSIDHRDLGRELELFATSPVVGAGLPLWLPDGAVIRAELEAYAAEEARRSGCRGVYTPVLGKKELFERSGHWSKFSAEMFPEMKVGGESLLLRPANCPHHAQVYAARGRSYRELPFRLRELGSMFRSELSGVLGGLSRVRQISLDDAHVFCTPAQVRSEVGLAVEAIERCYRTLGITGHHYRLSLRGEAGGFLGSGQQWASAQDQLRQALTELNVPFLEAPGEAAFYGPKIDVQVPDARGREETLSTVQLDFNQPERFELEYTAEDGSRQRPVMIHRGLLGSMERLTALLVERFEGRMPPWLAPNQVSILPVGAEHGAAARLLRAALEADGIRVNVLEGGSLGRRIRGCRHRRDPYVAVIGADEVADESADVLVPASGRRAVVKAKDFVDHVVSDVRRRVLCPTASGSLP
ncbi:threonine--tRNA ligase [Rhodococcus jostii]|uniref:Threonine--tRNA ligase n=1 Tax=Rhodococcus jostii TaxID=132919 RepID=A0A1H4TLF3_RHOJO|nr:threonine--tRNA ligase [Rhodococcus jostii]SEC57323.1 threonyl-tRNA synthetase [Rhodococcus jostii]